MPAAPQQKSRCALHTSRVSANSESGSHNPTSPGHSGHFCLCSLLHLALALRHLEGQFGARLGHAPDGFGVKKWHCPKLNRQRLGRRYAVLSRYCNELCSAMLPVRCVADSNSDVQSCHCQWQQSESRVLLRCCHWPSHWHEALPVLCCHWHEGLSSSRVQKY